MRASAADPVWSHSAGGGSDGLTFNLASRPTTVVPLTTGPGTQTVRPFSQSKWPSARHSLYHSALHHSASSHDAFSRDAFSRDVFNVTMKDMDSTPIELAELVLIVAIRLLPERLRDQVLTIKHMLDVIPFSAAPWVRITAHNHIPILSIDKLAGKANLLPAIDAYLSLTAAHRPNSSQARCCVSHVAVDTASGNGHTHILDLFLSHFGATKMPYSTLAIDTASAHGHVHVLNWWVASQIRPLKYTHHALTDASIHAHLPVMHWWKASGLVCLYDMFRVLRHASRHAHLDVLQWYRDFLDRNMYCPPGVMEEAAAKGQVAVLEWWTHCSHVPLLYKHAMDAATKAGKVDVLAWFVDRGPKPLLFSVKALEDVARERGRNDAVVKWWGHSGLLDSVYLTEE